MIGIGKDIEQLWSDFMSLYKLIEAAGGVVYNAKKEILLIHRLGVWDLPKGKIDDGETPEQAAIREVEEETGVGEITLGRLLAKSYHTYWMKEKRILKRTYWYEMHTTDTKTLVPQAEENIDKALWTDWKTFWKTKSEIYRNILSVIQES